MYNSHNVATAIKKRAKQKDIVIKTMLEDLSLGSNTMSAMYHGKAIAFDSLARIADYLGCSVDYLLGRSDTPSLAGKAEAVQPERQDQLPASLLDSYNALNAEGREKLEDYADDLVTSGKYKKIDPSELGQKEG